MFIVFIVVIGSLYKFGLLIMCGYVLEGLNYIDMVIFDKIGIFIEGCLMFKQVLFLCDFDVDCCLVFVVVFENCFEYFIVCVFGCVLEVVDSVVSYLGLGFEGLVEGCCLCIGQVVFVSNLGGSVMFVMFGDFGQWLLFGDEQGLLVWFGFDDCLCSDVFVLFVVCKVCGWCIFLLFGDVLLMVVSVVVELGIDEVCGGLILDDKLVMFECLYGEGCWVLMFGDGVNDVLVFVGVDISVVMGSVIDLVKISVDVVFLFNCLDSLVQVFWLVCCICYIIIENLVWVSLYNGLVLFFVVFGWIILGWVVIGMLVSLLLVVVNVLWLI